MDKNLEDFLDFLIKLKFKKDTNYYILTSKEYIYVLYIGNKSIEYFVNTNNKTIIHTVYSKNDINKIESILKEIPYVNKLLRKDKIDKLMNI